VRGGRTTSFERCSEHAASALHTAAASSCAFKHSFARTPLSPSSSARDARAPGPWRVELMRRHASSQASSMKDTAEKWVEALQSSVMMDQQRVRSA
jgi:hypothetical protein